MEDEAELEEYGELVSGFVQVEEDVELDAPELLP